MRCVAVDSRPVAHGLGYEITVRSDTPLDTLTMHGDLLLTPIITDGTIELSQEAVTEYLDDAIRSWRKRRDAKSPLIGAKYMAECYIDAFQSVRITLFGELLGMEDQP